MLSVERYRDSTYSSADESTYNYEEIELANGTKIKEITDKAGRAVCRKIREKTGESNGTAVYGAETESYRVVYKTDANGETLDEIDYTLDKMPAIEAGTPEMESLWTKREYHYKENGEIDYVSRRGKWTGLEREERDAGERVTKEIYSVSEIYMSQTYGYEYETREGAVIPDNRIKRMVMYGDATGSHQTETTEYSYDELGRVTKREYIGNKSGTSAYLYETYSYRPRKGLNICHQAEESGSTNYVSGIQYRCGSETGTEFAEYDRNGNISRIQLGTMITTYKYDGIDRLTEEENGFILKTSHYGYDGSGNIREVYTKAKNGAAWETREAYQYDANHPDRLTKITTYDLTNNTSSEKTIGNYDELGNPRSYKGNTLTWVRGRVLKSYGNKASYEYDGENIRQKKTEGGRTHEYYTGIDGRILGERVTENGIQTMYRYMYEGEQVIGLVKNGTEVYHYQYGTSGDIVRICDAQGSVVARYNYDAWGKCRVYTSNWVDITENSGYNNHIGRINPFRYKGYYYDEGTGLYYLQSRYYDPETRRFVNADNVGVVSEDYLTTIGGQNLYSYSLNNPVNHYDPTGHSVITTIIGVLFSVVMLIGSLYGLVEAVTAFLKEPSWLNLLFGLLALVDVGMSGFVVYKAFKNYYRALNATGGRKMISPATWDPSVKGYGKRAVKLRATRKVRMSVQEYLDKFVDKEYHEKVRVGFGKDAIVSVTKKDIKVRRYYGGNNAKGHWITPYKYRNKISALALNAEENAATDMAEFTLKKGTYIIEGKVVPLNGQFGGGYQYYVWTLDALI